MDNLKNNIRKYGYFCLVPTILNLVESTMSLIFGFLYSHEDKSGIVTLFLKIYGVVVLWSL